MTNPIESSFEKWWTKEMLPALENNQIFNTEEFKAVIRRAFKCGWCGAIDQIAIAAHNLAVLKSVDGNPHTQGAEGE